MRAKLQSAAIGAFILMLAVLAAPVAHAQAAFIFDLPAQPLGDSLRAVAGITRSNIVFDPDVVAGVEAPPLKGSVTAREAIAKLLAGTRLRPVDVGPSTIRIARITDRDPNAHRWGAASGERRKSLATPPNSHGGGAGQRKAPGSSTTTPAAEGPVSTTGVSRPNLSQVVVTGTRIAGVEPASPVITIGRTEIDESGYSSVGQLLLSVPENFSGGQNPGVVGALGNNQLPTGAFTADLFGLGPDSTLTLVNGHRLAYDGYQNGVDLSLIPLAAVDRVEIMTDGGSAIYGSDAVAGVVNVILKKHYDGLTADARYGDVTSGQAGRMQYSVLAGHSWTGGNAVAAYEYSHDDALYASERPFSSDAGQPTTLFPELNRSSFFLSAHQSLSDAVTASIDALYTRRSYASVATFGPAQGNSIDYAQTGVEEFGVTPEIAFALPGDWILSLSGTLSKDSDTNLVPEYSASTLRLLRSDLDHYQNQMHLGQIDASGTAFRLPSGPVKLAVGAGYRGESFDLVPAGPNGLITHASRHVRFGYVEADIPVVLPDGDRTFLESLTITAAYRRERYSDFGAQSTPKVGLAYVPFRALRLRATWSKSFRAPELEYAYGLRQLYVVPAQFLGGVAGSDALLAYGSNAALGPERATSRTVGFDFTPPSVPALEISSTYFNIDYSDRIVEPIDNTLSALSDPLYAPFVTANPTAALQAALVAQATQFGNFSSTPYDPQSIAELVDDAYQNAALQRIHGVDLAIQSSFAALTGRIRVAASGTWLTLRQQTISTAPEMLLSGTIFNPPHFKGRATVNWQRSGWSVTAAYNFVDSESDDTSAPAVPVGSWSTVDMQLAYAFGPSSRSAILRNIKLSLSVQNLLDRYPPFVAARSTAYPGLGYDSTNASPLGRFISAYVSKSW